MILHLKKFDVGMYNISPSYSSAPISLIEKQFVNNVILYKHTNKLKIYYNQQFYSPIESLHKLKRHILMKLLVEVEEIDINLLSLSTFGG